MEMFMQNIFQKRLFLHKFPLTSLEAVEKQLWSWKLQLHIIYCWIQVEKLLLRLQMKQWNGNCNTFTENISKNTLSSLYSYMCLAMFFKTTLFSELQSHYWIIHTSDDYEKGEEPIWDQLEGEHVKNTPDVEKAPSPVGGPTAPKERTWKISMPSG